MKSQVDDGRDDEDFFQSIMTPVPLKPPLASISKSFNFMVLLTS